MAKKKTATDRPDGPKSEALKNYEKHLDQLMAFLERLTLKEVQKASRALKRVVETQVALVPLIDIKKLERATAVHTAAVNKWLAFVYPACRWMSVMQVAFLESYLEDGLMSIAAKNPSLLKDAHIETSRILEVESMDELRSEIRLNWAHGALRPGGPETWRNKLRKLGAPEIDEKTVRGLQHLWDTRNLIVHSRCIASAAYAKKYANLGAKTGVEVNLNLHTFQSWIVPVKEFVEWADAFFLKYGGQN